MRFRSFLLKDGYHMVQYSVYARVCPGTDAVEKHRQRIMEHLPKNGAIRMLTVTEKQYEGIDILLGGLTQADGPFESETGRDFQRACPRRSRRCASARRRGYRGRDS